MTGAFEELIADLKLSPLYVKILRDLIHFKVSTAEQGEPKLEIADKRIRANF